MADVEGLDGLDALIASQVQALGGESLMRATAAAAAPILAEAQRRAPVLTGEVLASLHIVSTHTATHASSSVEVADSTRGGDAHEAIFSEYGTVHEPARPFMRPAYETQKEAAEQAFERQLSQELNHP